MNNSEDIAEFIRHYLPDLTLEDPPAPLPGGLMNHVWKVPTRPKPVILKHAPPYIATVPEIKLDDSRIIFEAEALQALLKGGALEHVPTPYVSPPELLYRNDVDHVIVLEDIGDSVDLTVWLSHSKSSADKFGAFLGEFIGSLHRESLRQTILAQRFNNHSIQQTRYTVQYESIGPLCIEAGVEDAEDLGLKARQLGTRLLQKGICLIMGDLWPASIHITPEGIRIIDWEFVHFGNPAQDIAHLASHLWMLKHRIPTCKPAVEDFWKNFINTYQTAIEPNYSDLWPSAILEDASIHFGSEVLVRTIGPFKQSYLYDDLSPNDSLLKEAILEATHRIRSAHMLLNLESLLDSSRPQ